MDVVQVAGLEHELEVADLAPEAVPYVLDAYYNGRMTPIASGNSDWYHVGDWLGFRYEIICRASSQVTRLRKMGRLEVEEVSPTLEEIRFVPFDHEPTYVWVGPPMPQGWGTW